MASNIVVRTGDRDIPITSHPIVVILDNLRSAYNVGNIFRLAETCRIEQIVTCGYTATPPHPKLEKTARGCERLVPCTHYDSSLEAVRILKDRQYHVVAVETVEHAPAAWEHRYQLPLAVVFGNEALGIDPDTLSLCDAAVQLPCYGTKNSLNVSNSAAVVLYTVIRQIVSR